MKRLCILICIGIAIVAVAVGVFIVGSSVTFGTHCYCVRETSDIEALTMVMAAYSLRHSSIHPRSWLEMQEVLYVNQTDLPSRYAFGTKFAYSHLLGDVELMLVGKSSILIAGEQKRGRYIIFCTNDGHFAHEWLEEKMWQKVQRETSFEFAP